MRFLFHLDLFVSHVLFFTFLYTIRRVMNGDLPEFNYLRETPERERDTGYKTYRSLARLIEEAQRHNPHFRCILFFTSPNYNGSVSHPDLLTVANDKNYLDTLRQTLASLPKPRKGQQLLAGPVVLSENIIRAKEIDNRQSGESDGDTDEGAFGEASDDDEDY